MTREQIEKKAVERFPHDSNDALHKHVTEWNRQAYIEGALMVVEAYEQQVKSVDLADVSGQSELLIAFADWVFNQPKHLGGRERELVAEYLKAINSH